VSKTGPAQFFMHYRLAGLARGALVLLESTDEDEKGEGI
jgi:hypothetical protein